MNQIKSFHRNLVVAAAALFLVFFAQLAAAQDNPTSITYTILNTCNQGGFGGFDLEVGGSSVGTLPATGDCTCSPPLRTFTTTDPADLALVGAPGCTDVAVDLIGATYISWVRAEITRSVSGTETFCLVDTNGGNCNVNNLCSAGYTTYSGTRFTGGAPDLDGDSIPDCSDPDDDNDGILDGADNCPLVANADQADSDNNGTGDLCQPVVVAVPWLGNPNNPHQVFSGGTLMLQAASFLPSSGEAASLASATWDPGDGSGPQAISVANPRALELAHTYAGALGQPFTAFINATDSAGNTYSDTFKVIIAPNTLDTTRNMAKDHGLWRLYKQAQLGTSSNGMPTAKWKASSTNYEEAATAAAVQAFEINGHLEAGNVLENPYVPVVASGLAYLFSQLATDALSLQGGNDPDGNGNGIGLRARTASNHWNYISGQVMDAIVGSGTPGATATTGSADVLGRRYDDIMQDMIDQYAWGATDGGPNGGWDYRSFNNTGSGGNNDSSASHWWAIGTMAGETWGLDSPQWLKDQNFGSAIPFWQPAPNGSGTDTCPCGYRSQSTLWDGGWNTTAACMIMMNADDIPQDNARFTCAERWIANNFYGAQSGYSGNWYDMFQTKKAMLTALDSAGDTASIDLLNGTIDWFDEYSQEIVDHQLANGSWDTWSAGTAGGQVQQDMRTAWAVIILTPALFELGPVASCSADPTTVGLNQLVDFDASGSSHQDPGGTIVSWDWDFDDGNTDVGETTTHDFGGVGTYNVTVTVTDEGGLTDSSTCAVEVSDTDLPPNANTGGPYEFCEGDAIVFDGSGSSDAESAIASYEWDWTAPVGDFAGPDGSTAVVDASASFPAPGGPFNIGLRVTDSDTIPKTNSEFTTFTIKPATDPTCNQPPVAVASGPYTVDEGGTVGLSGSASSDPDADVLTYGWDLDDNGSFETAGETPTFDAGSLDDSVLTVSVLVSDPSGASDESSTTVTVLNVAPAVDAGADDTINEGDTFNGGGSFTDPGTLDTWTATVDYGDGSGSQALALTGSNFSLSHVYADDGVYTVTVTITDDDGGEGSDTVMVTVLNVAPTVGADAPSVTVNESETAANTGTFGDLGDDVVTITASAGSVSQAGSQNGTWSWSYDSTDGPDESQTVTITATDSDGASSTTTFDLTVENVAPTVGADAPSVTVNESETAANTGTFGDLGDDVVTISASAGSVSQAGSQNGTWSWSYDSTDGPDESQTVTITATDSDGAFSTTTFDLTVENVAPTVGADAPSVTVDESVIAGNTGTFGDLGDDVVTITASAGSVGQAGSQNGTWNWSYASTDGPTESQTVTITATDSDGAFSTTTFGLIVNNVAPSVGAGADDTINEGDTFVGGGSFSDPGADTWTATVDYGEGAGPMPLALAGNSFSLNNVYDDDGIYTVTVTVTDDDGGVGSDTVIVTVLNAAPTVDADAPSVTVDESETAANTGTFGDPGDDVVTITASAGSVSQTGSQNGTWSWSYNSTDGPDESQTVTITATDSDGAFSTTTFDLTVVNVAPTVDADAPSVTVNESETAANTGTFGDLGDDVVTITASVGSVSQAGSQNGTWSWSFATTDGPAESQTVTITATDSDGAFSTTTFDLTVVNVAPVIESVTGDTIDENGTATVSGIFSDVGILDSFTVTIDWGEGAPEDFSYPAGTIDFSQTHQYLDDNPTGTASDVYNITVTVTDNDGGSDSDDTADVTVNNIAPEVGDITVDIDLIEVGTEIAASASFTDTGTQDTHAAEWNWGDGTSSGSVTQGPGSGSVEDVHTYNEAGVYTIELTVTDDDTGTDSVIYQYIVVYDPGAGFVTGGGWINSPVGAYVPDPELTGRANFGFVSKYKKGKTVPEGSTEFQFKAGDINFHSNDYEWLVVTHHKATFKGVGTINGDGNFGFMLKAIDEKLTPSTDVDLFSIKIWDRDDGDTVVYDNGLGAATDEDPAQAIDGGQIVIHTKK